MGGLDADAKATVPRAAETGPIGRGGPAQPKAEGLPFEAAAPGACSASMRDRRRSAKTSIRPRTNGSQRHQEKESNGRPQSGEYPEPVGAGEVTTWNAERKSLLPARIGIGLSIVLFGLPGLLLWVATHQGLLHGAFQHQLRRGCFVLLPVLFSIPWAVQRSQNTTVGMVVHAGVNGPGFLAVTLGLQPDLVVRVCKQERNQSRARHHRPK